MADTMARLTEIKARADAATEGPWEACGTPYRDWRNLDPVVNAAGDRYVCQTVYDMQSWSQDHNVDADTEFIAHARDDVPWLCDLAGRLMEMLRQAEWDQWDRDAGASCGECGGWEDLGHNPGCAKAGLLGLRVREPAGG